MHTGPFRLTEDHLSLKAGATLYRCKLPNYGCWGDDERATGEEHQSMTEDPEGGYPFTIVPVRKLIEL